MSQGDIALGLMNAAGTDGSNIEIANTTSLVLRGKGGTPMTPGIRSRTKDDDVNKTVQGTILLTGINGAQTIPSIYRLNNNDLINTVTSGNDANVKLGQNSTLDLNRYAQELRILNGSGKIDSDPIPGQARTLTFSSQKAYDTSRFDGTIQGSVGLRLKNKVGDTGATLNQSGTLILTGANDNFTGGVTIEGGTVIGASSSSMGTGTIQIGKIASKNDQSAFAIDPSLIGQTSITINNPIRLVGKNFQVLNFSGQNTINTRLDLTDSLTVDVKPNPDSTALPWSLTLDQVITGIGQLKKTNAGLLILTKTNDFLGGLDATGGTVEVQGSNSLGNGKVTFRQNTNLQMRQPAGATTPLNLVIPTSTGIVFEGNNQLISIGDAQITADKGSLNLKGATNGVFTIDVASGKRLTLNSTSAFMAIDSGNTSADLVRANSGALYLNGPNNFRNLVVRSGSVVGNVAEAFGKGEIQAGRLGTTNTYGTIAFDPGIGNTLKFSNTLRIQGKGSSDSSTPVSPDQSVIKTLSGNVIFTGLLFLESTPQVSTLPIYVQDGAVLDITSQIDDKGANLTLEKKGLGNLILRLPNNVPANQLGGVDIKSGIIQVFSTRSLGTGLINIFDGGSLYVDLGYDPVTSLPIQDTFSNPFRMSGFGPKNTSGAINVVTGHVVINRDIYLDGNTGFQVDSVDAVLEHQKANILQNGTFGIVKKGQGTLVLEASTGSNFTGASRIDTGIVVARSTNSLGQAPWTIPTGTGLKIDAATPGVPMVLNNNLTVVGTGYIPQPGTGIDPMIGVIESESGTVATIQGNVTLTGETTLYAEDGPVANDGLTINGVIDESKAGQVFGITKKGTGRISFGGSTANAYVGNTLVQEGTLELLKSDAAGPTGLVTVDNGASLGIGSAPNASTTIGNVITGEGTGYLGQGALVASGGKGTLTKGFVVSDTDSSFTTQLYLGAKNLGDLTISGPITVPIGGGLTPVDLVSADGGVSTGTVRLAATNGYNGTTTVQAGTLVSAAVNSTGTNNKLTVLSGGTFEWAGSDALNITDYQIQGTGNQKAGALKLSKAFRNENGKVTFNGDASIGVDGGQILTLSSPIGESPGTQSDLIKQGDGQLILPVANAYAGDTQVLGGTLKIKNSGALGSNKSSKLSVAQGATLAIDLLLSGGTGTFAFDNNLDLTGDGFAGAGAIDLITGDASFTGSLANSFGGKSVTLNTEGTNRLILLGDFTKSGLETTKLVKKGTGNLTLGGNNSFDPSGAATTSVTQGVLTLWNQEGASESTINVSENAKLEISNKLGMSSPMVFSNKVELSGFGPNPGPNLDSDAALWVGGFEGGKSVPTSALFTGTVNIHLSSQTSFGRTKTALGAGPVSAGRFEGIISQNPDVGSNQVQIVKNGQGDIALVPQAGPNQFRGGLEINDGTLIVGATGGAGSGPLSTIQIDKGKLLLQGGKVDAPVTLTNQISIGTGNIGIGTDTNSFALITKDFTSLAPQFTLEARSGSELTLSGAILKDAKLSSLSLNKTGAGKLTLASTKSNQVNGGFNVSDGTVDLKVANAPTVKPFDGPLTIENNAIVNLALPNQIPSNATLTLNTGGTLDLVGKNTLVGQVRLTNGNIISSGGTVGTLTSDNDFALDSGTVSANLAGKGGVVKSGPAGLTLSGSNSYQGATTVNAGILTVDGGNAIPNSSTVTLAGSTSGFNLKADEIIPNLVVQDSGSTLSLNGKSLTFSVPDQDTLLKGIGLPTGGTLVKQGTKSLIIQNGSALGSADVKVDPTAGLVFDFGGSQNFNNNFTLGGRLGSTQGNATLDGNIIFGTGALTASINGLVKFSKPSTKAGNVNTLSLIKTGVGSLDLNTTPINGGITIQAGNLIGSQLDSFGTTGVTVQPNGTLTLNANGTFTNAFTIQGTGQDGIGALRATGGTSSVPRFITVNNLNLAGSSTISVDEFTTLTIAGISGSGTLTKIGKGKLIISTGQSLPGPLVINDGEMVYNSSITGTITIGKGGVLVIPTTVTIPNPINLAGTIRVEDSVVGTLVGAISLTGDPAFQTKTGATLLVNSPLSGSVGVLDISGPGLVNISGANNFSGKVRLSGPATTAQLLLGGNNALGNLNDLEISAGTVKLGASLAVGTLLSANDQAKLELAGFNLTFGSSTDQSYAGAITGNGQLIKQGTGKQSFGGKGKIDFLGDLLIQAGSVVLNKDASVLPALPANVTIGKDSTLTIASPGQLGATANVKIVGGTLDLGSNKESVNGVNLQGNGSIIGTGSIRSATPFDLMEGTILSALEGTAGLKKTGAGTVTLGKTNPLTGAVNLAEGILAIGATQTFADLNGTGGEISLLSGSNLILNVSANKSYAGKFSGSGTLTKIGTGDLTLTGSSPITGETIVQQGKLILNQVGSFALSGTVSVKGGGVLELGSSNQLKSDGTVNLQGGTFSMNGNDQILSVLDVGPGSSVTGGNSSDLSVSGKVILRTTRDQIKVNLLGSADLVYRLSGADTIVAPLALTGSFIVESGTVTLSSNSTPTVTGNVISRGTSSILILGLSNQISDGSTIQIQDAGVVDVGSNSDTVQGINLLDGTIKGTTGVLKSASNITVESGLISGILDGTNASIGLVKTNPGATLTITSANRFQGEVQVSAGPVVLNSLGTALASKKITVNGGNLQVSLVASAPQLSSDAKVLVSAGSLDVANTNQILSTLQLTGGQLLSNFGSISTKEDNFLLTNGTVSATLAGATTGVVVSGPGTVIFEKTNVYGGATQVTGGTLVGNAKGTSIPSGLIITSGKLLLRESSQIATNSKVQVSGGSLEFATSGLFEKFSELSMTDGLIGTQAGGPIGSLEVDKLDLQKGRINSVIKGSAKLVKTTNGTVTLSGANSFTGGTEVQGGTLNLATLQGPSLPGDTLVNGGTIVSQAQNQFGGGLQVKSGVVDLGSFRASVTGLVLNGGEIRGTTGILFSSTSFQVNEGKIDAILGGSTGLTKNGSGVVVLSKPAQYSGPTSIQSGLLQLKDTGGLPDTSPVEIKSNGLFDLNGLNEQIGGLNGSGAINLGTQGTNTLTFGDNGPLASSFAGIISGLGGLTKVGLASQSLSGPNNFSGQILVQSGNLVIEGTAASVLPDNAPITVAKDATLTLKKDEQTGPLTGQGNLSIDSGKTLNAVYVASSTGELILSGLGTFRKAGSEKLTLTSNSLGFGGKVAIAQGSLELDGLVGGTVELQSGNLNGTGSLNKLNGLGGTFTPGNGPGVMNIGTFGLSTGTVYQSEIFGTQPGQGYDQTIVTQSVNLSGSSLLVKLGNGFTPGNNSTYTIIDNQSTSLVTGVFQGLPEGAVFTVGKSRFKITYRGGNGNDVVLTATQSNSSGVGLVMGSPGGVGTQSFVTVYNNQGTIARTFIPFANYAGPLLTASGDITGDGVTDIIVSTGAGSVPAVKVFDGVSGNLIRSFMAYATNFAGGVCLASGDIDGDGFADIITGTLTGSSHIKVFSGKDNTQLRSFYGFGANYTGGVNIASADVDGDQRADIIVGAAKSSSNVAVFSGLDNKTLLSFYAFGTGTLSGGVFVSAADLNGDGKADILVGKGSGGGTPQMKVFNGPNATPGITVNLNVNYTNGVRVQLADTNGDGQLDLVAGTGPGFQPVISYYASANGAFLKSFNPYPTTFRGGVVF